MVTIDSAIPAEQLHSINSQTIPSSSGCLGTPSGLDPTRYCSSGSEMRRKRGQYSLTILQEYYYNFLSVDKVFFFFFFWHTMQIVEKLKEIQPSKQKENISNLPTRHHSHFNVGIYKHILGIFFRNKTCGPNDHV